MALQKCELNLNSAAKELRPHGSLEFPCAAYATHYTDRPEDIIPWHWHEEMEIIYMESGQMTVKIPSQTFLLKKGDCIVINANVLHYAAAAPECMLHSLVFRPELISGKEEFAFAKKYMQPLLNCPAFSGYFIDGKTEETVACWFSRAFEALAGDTYGFEFTVRENLSRICLFLHRKFAPIDAQAAVQGQDDLRIRKMIACIQKNYADDITLADIARAADISERECLRCFQKMIQVSPIQYLLKYRVMQGAKMLTENPEGSISEIATGCGFDSQSNFAKKFKRFYNCTPREYRKREVERTLKEGLTVPKR